MADLRQLAIQLSQVHREWCKQANRSLSLGMIVFADLIQNLEAWQAAQAAIRDIDPHPNQPPASAAHTQVTKLFDQSQAPPDPYSTSSSPAPAPAPSQSQPPSATSPLHMGGLRDEIDRVEAANIPLPLPTDDPSPNVGEATARSTEQGVSSPLGPL